MKDIHTTKQHMSMPLYNMTFIAYFEMFIACLHLVIIYLVLLSTIPTSYHNNHIGSMSVCSNFSTPEMLRWCNNIIQLPIKPAGACILIESFRRSYSVELYTINYLHVSQGGDDHQLVSADRKGVILMPINTLYSDSSLQTMY